MLDLSQKTLSYIINHISILLSKTKSKEIIEFKVINPDILSSSYNGQKLTINTHTYIYRGFKTYIDLAQNLYCKMLTPMMIDENFIIIRYEKLNISDSFHQNIQNTQDREKYGIGSIYSEINKNEESAFLIHFLKALENVKIKDGYKILNLGINSGDEFELLKSYIDTSNIEFDSLELTGIDYCPSAIQSANEKFKNHSNIKLINHDISNLSALNLDRFDLIISIGTLQSSNLELKPLFMSIIQNQLAKGGAVIFGFPNCRWIDGEMIYGAKVRNYNFPEMSVLIKDIYFCKKYLQQKRFRTILTGKDYLFLTGVSISY
jgi:hypothetical protein